MTSLLEPEVVTQSPPRRDYLNPWFAVPDLVGDGLYDTPDGAAPDSSDVDIFFDEDWHPHPEQFFEPGYTGELLQTGFAIARFLPDDVFLPLREVHAMLTTALHWGKALDVSWMQMDVDPDFGFETPRQHDCKGAALARGWQDREAKVYRIVFLCPDGEHEVRADCITHLRLVNLVPDPPKPKRQTRFGPVELANAEQAEQARAAKVAYDVEDAPRRHEDHEDYVQRVLSSLATEYVGIQVDG